jgi:hypothetical protein
MQHSTWIAVRKRIWGHFNLSFRPAQIALITKASTRPEINKIKDLKFLLMMDVSVCPERKPICFC